MSLLPRVSPLRRRWRCCTSFIVLTEGTGSGSAARLSVIPSLRRRTRSVVRHGARRKPPLLCGPRVNTHPELVVCVCGCVCRSVLQDVDVKICALTRTCGEACDSEEKRVSVLSPPVCVCSAGGSDSTCLRRLGLSPGSIFAVLFCDPVGRRTITVCTMFHLQEHSHCPICPPV